MITDDNQIKIIYLLIYLLPTFIALFRRPDFAVIFSFNVILSWTGIGWIIAFIWACYPNKRSCFGPINEQVDLEEFHRQRIKYLDYKINREEIEYQIRKRRVPAVCDRCGEADPCICLQKRDPREIEANRVSGYNYLIE